MLCNRPGLFAVPVMHDGNAADQVQGIGQLIIFDGLVRAGFRGVFTFFAVFGFAVFGVAPLFLTFTW